MTVVATESTRPVGSAASDALQTPLGRALELLQTSPEEGRRRAVECLKKLAAEVSQLEPPQQQQQQQQQGKGSDAHASGDRAFISGASSISELFLHHCVAGNQHAARLLLEQQQELGFPLKVDHIGPAVGLAKVHAGSTSGMLSTGALLAESEDADSVPGDGGGSSSSRADASVGSGGVGGGGGSGKPRSQPRTQGCTTPLIAAARAGDADLVQLLLEHRADPTLAVGGWTAREAAQEGTGRQAAFGVAQNLGLHGDGSSIGTSAFTSMGSSAQSFASASAAKRRCVELLDTCLRQKALDAAARNAGAEGSGSLPAQGASSGM